MAGPELTFLQQMFEIRKQKSLTEVTLVIHT
jgi:hypothetical protein